MHHSGSAMEEDPRYNVKNPAGDKMGDKNPIRFLLKRKGGPRPLLEQVTVVASAAAAVPFIAGAQFLPIIFVVCDFALRCNIFAPNIQLFSVFNNRAQHQLD